MQSIKDIAKGIYKEKGSKFISIAYPVENELQVKEILEHIRKEYYDASHFCYAYRIGESAEFWRTNDDGEPSSTAGKPILGQLISNDLTDVLLVVIRYFGGVKLGVSGLISAYKTAAADALQNAIMYEKIYYKELSLSFDYENYNHVIKLIRQHNLSITNQVIDNITKIEIKVQSCDFERIKEILNKNKIFNLE